MASFFLLSGFLNAHLCPISFRVCDRSGANYSNCDSSYKVREQAPISETPQNLHENKRGNEVEYDGLKWEIQIIEGGFAHTKSISLVQKKARLREIPKTVYLGEPTPAEYKVHRDLNLAVHVKLTFLNIGQHYDLSLTFFTMDKSEVVSKRWFLIENISERPD